MLTAGTRSAELFQQFVDALVDEGMESGDFTIDYMRYAQMESLGHGLGKELSRQVQETLAQRQRQQMPDALPCPDCQNVCRAEDSRKTIRSVDGSVELPEVRFHCKKCRKSFFPSA
jgi:hypothetical protein